MALDSSFVNPMLDPFRKMLRDLEAKDLGGRDMDLMRESLGTMERWAQEMDDIISYSTRLTTEGLFLKFSEAYGRALGAAAQRNQPTDDAGLLQQSLAAYEDSYNRLKNDPHSQHLLPPLVKILEIGRSGVTYPVFLRKAEEEGLFERMKNGDQEPTLEFDLHVAQVMGDPIREELCRKKLDTYHSLCAKHPFGLADNVEFEIAGLKLEWEYAPRLNEWKSIIEHWEKLHDMVFDWLDAHCSFAPSDGRWLDPRGQRYTMENIQRTKETVPGQLKVREAIFQEYHGLSWDQVWTHPTYLSEQKACRIFASDERLELMKATYPVCVLGKTPPADVISRNQAIFRNGTERSERHRQRFGDQAHPGPGYDFAQFSDFVKKHLSPS